jgi:fructose-1,6-bisphosphatase
MSIEPKKIHEQSPIFIGSRENVLKAMEFLAAEED